MTNPLLQPSTLPHGAPDLSITDVALFLPALTEAIAEAKANVEKIKNNPAPADFRNTIEALEFVTEKASRVMSIFSNLVHTNGTEALRAIEEEMGLLYTNMSNDIALDEKLFARIEEAYNKKETLTAEQQMLAKETYKSFVRGGARLDAAGKKRYREISEEMSKLRTAYGNNCLESAAAYQKVIDTKAELAGVPERALNNYRAAADAAGMKGKYLIKLSPPPIDIFSYCENRSLREEIMRAFSSIAYKGAHDNSQNVLDIVRLRDERAKLLGFPTHADYVLDNRMAKDVATVKEFLQSNHDAYRPAAEEYLEKVRAFAKQKDGIDDLKPWDMAYYGRQLKEQTFNLNLEELRPYFNLENVLDGLRQHAEKLFNITMKEVKGTYPVYHEDVKVYEVIDRATNSVIGLFYGDYYARSGAKKAGAWMDQFRGRGFDSSGVNQIPIVTNVCNFDKPTKEQPTLLSIDEVRTVFHEFGHGLHALLAKGDYASLTGTNVKWDFVELPSQLQENWAKKKEVLDTFAKHAATGETIPDALIQRLNDMENFDAGYFGLRQTLLAKIDMAWHSSDPKTLKSVEEVEDALVALYWLFPRAAGPTSTSFSHIFAGGYDAGYVSYKWAEVLEADIFEAFEQKGLYDRDTAQRLGSTIYAKGGTVEPMDLFIEMMGRKPDPTALFRREGLTAPPANNNDDAKPNKVKG